MSFLSGQKGKDKDKDPFAKKSQFYVEFLGWMECRGVRGARYTDPVIRELRRRQQKMDTPPKLTIQVSKKDLKVTQDVEDKKKRNIKKIKFPAIPARDVTYVRQGTRPGDGRPDDIVACIYLGFMPRTQRFVHVHVYRFDEATTAATFARQMSTLVEANMQHIRDVEIDLANKGEIEDPRLSSSDGLSEPHTTDSAVGSTSSAYSDDEVPNVGSDDIDPDLQSLHEVTAFDNVADELRFRLQMGDKPLLLPPKDYDTISRAHGNLEQVGKRKCLNMQIVGEWASTARERNGSNESGVDVSSPISEVPEGDTIPSGPASPSSQTQYTTSNSSHPHTPQSPHPPGGHRRGDSIGQGSVLTQSSHHSGGSRSISPDATGEILYPPRLKSPPMSPQIGPAMVGNRGLRGSHLSRQNSAGSFHSHNSGEDIQPIRNGVQYYKGGSSNDIYALPNKGRYVNGGPQAVSPRDIPPADYGEEDREVQMRGPGPRYRGPPLTRSMPADMIRSEMAMSPKSARTPRTSGELRNSGEFRTSGDFRNVRHTNSPTYAIGAPQFGGPQQYPSQGPYNQPTKRVTSAHTHR